MLPLNPTSFLPCCQTSLSSVWLFYSNHLHPFPGKPPVSQDLLTKKHQTQSSPATLNLCQNFNIKSRTPPSPDCQRIISSFWPCWGAAALGKLFPAELMSATSLASGLCPGPGLGPAIWPALRTAGPSPLPACFRQEDDPKKVRPHQNGPEERQQWMHRGGRRGEAKLMDKKESNKWTVRYRKDTFKLPPSSWPNDGWVCLLFSSLRVCVSVQQTEIAGWYRVLYESVCARVNTIPHFSNTSWQLAAGTKASFIHNSAVNRSSTAGLPVQITIWKVIRNEAEKPHSGWRVLLRLKYERWSNYICITITL